MNPTLFFLSQWLSHFDDTSAVFFLAALSHYAERSQEAGSRQNRLKEALLVFKEASEAVELRGCPTVLFLNKNDLFERELARTPLAAAFSSYSGDGSVGSALRFVEKRFRKTFSKCSDELKTERKLFVHITVATERSSIEKACGNVWATLLEDKLAADGLM